MGYFSSGWILSTSHGWELFRLLAKNNLCCGGRLFIVLFILLAVFGLLTLPYSETIIYKYFDLTRTWLIIFCIFVIGLSDTCHDLLMGPTRSLLNDILTDENMDQGNNYFNTCAALGRVLGYGICFFPWLHVFPDLKRNFDMIQICFVLTSGVMMIVILISVIAACNLQQENHGSLSVASDEYCDMINKKGYRIIWK
eukprot:UN34916